ncbi:MAG: putative toxin-antitoxin system toxin component, PIN family [Chlorobiaceae bacterium]
MYGATLGEQRFVFQSVTVPLTGFEIRFLKQHRDREGRTARVPEFVSGIRLGGNPREVLRLCSTLRVVNFISPDIMQEVEDVLRRPKFGLLPEQVYRIMGIFMETFTMVTPTITVNDITVDRDDNRILEAAHAAEAQVVVSGDKHLLELVSWRGISILTPANFLILPR